jgi:protein O-mannosyl-transferase
MLQARNRKRPPARNDRERRGELPRLAIGGLLLLAIGLTFGQTVQHRFVNIDDNQCIYQNRHVTQGLVAKEVIRAFAGSYADNWVPLTWISHMLDWQLYRDHAGGHHLTDVLLHGLATALLFRVLRRTTGRLWPSALVAALFAVHPLRAESVAWVTERKDVLPGLFFVLTLAAYQRYARRPFSLSR